MPACQLGPDVGQRSAPARQRHECHVEHISGLTHDIIWRRGPRQLVRFFTQLRLEESRLGQELRRSRARDGSGYPISECALQIGEIEVGGPARPPIQVAETRAELPYGEP